MKKYTLGVRKRSITKGYIMADMLELALHKIGITDVKIRDVTKYSEEDIKNKVEEPTFMMLEFSRNDEVAEMVVKASGV